MPTLAEAQPVEFCKMLNVGVSGSGKTGAMVSLVRAGYNLKIIDHDNGLQILKALLDPEEQERVEVETITDRLKATPLGHILPTAPTAISRSLAALSRWSMNAEPDDVIVIDTLTRQGTFAMWTAMFEGRWWKVGDPSPTRPRIQDWGAAQQIQEEILQGLFSESSVHHVLVNAHIVHIDTPGSGGQVVDDKGKVHDLDPEVKGYPSALGRKLPPRVGSYFNTMVETKIMGGNRVINTIPSDTLDLKVPARDVKGTYPISTGLAELFELVAGRRPAGSE